MTSKPSLCVRIQSFNLKTVAGVSFNRSCILTESILCLRRKAATTRLAIISVSVSDRTEVRNFSVSEILFRSLRRKVSESRVYFCILGSIFLLETCGIPNYHISIYDSQDGIFYSIDLFMTITANDYKGFVNSRLAIPNDVIAQLVDVIKNWKLMFKYTLPNYNLTVWLQMFLIFEDLNYLENFTVFKISNWSSLIWFPSAESIWVKGKTLSFRNHSIDLPPEISNNNCFSPG